jgi:hypothetical protein
MSYKPTFNELQDRGLELQNRQPGGIPLVFKNASLTRGVAIGPGARVALWIGNGKNEWHQVWRGVPDSRYDFNTLYEELVEDATPTPDAAAAGETEGRS